MTRWTTGWNSMGWRIQCWYAAILIMVVTGLMIAIYHFEYQRRVTLLDMEGDALLQHILPEISPMAWADRANRAGPDDLPGPPRRRPLGPMGGPRGLGPRGPRGERPGVISPLDTDVPAKRERGHAIFGEKIERGAFVRVWNDNESILYDKGTPPEGIAYREASIQTQREDLQDYRLIWRIGPMRRTLVAGMPTREITESMRSFRDNLIISGVAIVSVVMLVGFVVVHRALRPVRTISETAREITRRDLSHRIDLAKGCTELDALGKVLNECFERLDESFTQQQRFTADASHELRTPVSVLLTTSQRMLTHERSPEEYRDAFLLCERSTMRMKRLVDDLTDLSRFDSGEVRLAVEDEDLGILAECIVTDLEAIASEGNTTFQLDLQPAPCHIDSARIEQVVTNLVMNAIRHNDRAVDITLKTWTEANQSFLEVHDNGKGIAEADQKHLFDRFYQVGHTLTRSSSGSGLGLAICKVIIEAHHGHIGQTSQPGFGASFRLTLPKERNLVE